MNALSRNEARAFSSKTIGIVDGKDKRGPESETP